MAKSEKNPAYKKAKVSDLIPYANNARTHSDEQVTQIASSIKEFGFINPVIVDADGGIIAGHGRVMAAKKLGIDEVPTLLVEHLSDAQKKAYILTDNKMALNAGWDDALLAIELQQLKELDFDLELTGFNLDEINGLLDVDEVEGLTDEDDVPEAPEEPVSKEGDVWVLGNHRLMCGDSTSIDAVEKLTNGTKIDMVFTDPPYGISIVGSNGSVGGEKLAKTGSYEPIAGDGSIDVALEAIQVVKTLGAKVEIIWGGNYYASALDNSSCWIVWDKDNTGNFADAELAWTNQKTAVRVFEHRWNGMLKASEKGEKRVHPTQKPIALAEWCFDQYGQDCSTVLDLFGGSGFTLMAAETRKKSSYIMELSPNYCDVMIKRWQDFTGKEAVHVESGKTYNELANV